MYLHFALWRVFHQASSPRIVGDGVLDIQCMHDNSGCTTGLVQCWIGSVGWLGSGFSSSEYAVRMDAQGDEVMMVLVLEPCFSAPAVLGVGTLVCR